jgi:hypothetical protein
MVGTIERDNAAAASAKADIKWQAKAADSVENDP